MKLLIVLIIGNILISDAQSSPIKVNVHFLEALAPKDTTSSERFQKEYEEAIATAKILSDQKLLKCGYSLEPKTIFYSASDPLESLERAKESEKNGAWILVGPRRSNHYVLLAKGAPSTPSISTMASSQEVSELGSLHLSVAPLNKQMAVVAAKEAKRRSTKSRITYVSVVSEDCVTCVDFSEHFDKEAKKLSISKVQDFRISGETPNLENIAKSLLALKPSFILLPNYSKVTAQSIAAFHKVSPESYFVGGDGWGDSRFGFLQNAKELDGASGFTVRGFPSTEEGLKKFPLGKSILTSKNQSVSQPGSGSALAILKIIDGLNELLCETKPKSKEDFSKQFTKLAKAKFQSPWGVSIYNLKNDNISFGRIDEGK